MREIKFRAWDKKSKKMFVVDVVNFRSQTIGVEAKPDPTRHPDFWIWRSIKMEDVELMQFTGLKDKNGKEIYEGDIIWYSVKFIDQKFMGQVVFEEAGFNLKSPLATELLPLYGADEIERIGDIYQNSELLAHPQEET